MELFLIRRVTGLFPFGSQKDAMLAKRIQNGLFARNNTYRNLSAQCQDLISHLLEVDSKKRYSAEEALQHPWFAGDYESATCFIPADLNTMDSSLDRVTSHRRNGYWLLMNRKSSNGNSHKSSLFYLA